MNSSYIAFTYKSGLSTDNAITHCSLNCRTCLGTLEKAEALNSIKVKPPLSRPHVNKQILYSPKTAHTSKYLETNEIAVITYYFLYTTGTTEEVDPPHGILNRNGLWIKRL